MRLFEEDYMDCAAIPTTFAEMERMLNDSHGGHGIDSDHSYESRGGNADVSAAFDVGTNYALESDDVGICDVSDEAWKKDIGELSLDLSDKSPISNPCDDSISLIVSGAGGGGLETSAGDTPLVLSSTLLVKTPGSAIRPDVARAGSTGRSKGSNGSGRGAHGARGSPRGLQLSPDGHSSISSQATVREASASAARRESDPLRSSGNSCSGKLTPTMINSLLTSPPLVSQ
jgi:hypothetical protein